MIYQVQHGANRLDFVMVHSVGLVYLHGLSEQSSGEILVAPRKSPTPFHLSAVYRRMHDQRHHLEAEFIES